MRDSGPGSTTVNRRRLLRLTGATVAGLAITGQGAASASAATPTGPVPGGAFPGIPAMPVVPVPDPLLAGEASIPVPAPRVPYAAEAGEGAEALAAAVPNKLPFEFKRSGYKCVANVPEAKQPWRDHRAPYVDRFAHDAEGVRMFKVDGKLYEHPVGQVQFGLENITSFRETKDVFYLERAKAQANRLISKHIEKGGAWYFPYNFNWNSPSHGLRYKAPWYSGMAQGEALSLFAQLVQLDAVTEAERTTYTRAAHGTFASLLRVATVKPWVVNKDSAGYLWIQEYPLDAPNRSDDTFNGYMFAALGLWDYHKLTGNPLAEQLFDGALTTLHKYFPVLRNVNWYSNYCVTHRIPTDGYHLIHMDLYRQLHWLSGSVKPAYLADVLMDDYPYPDLGATGTVQIAAGRHTLYSFNPNGTVKTSTSAQFPRATTAPTNKRIRIKGRGIHYLITAGRYKGLYIPESYPKVYLAGEWFRAEFLPQRKATFPAGVSIVCHKVSETGKVTASKTVRFAKPSAAPFDRRSIVNGRPMIRISAGSLTDFWVPAAQITPDGR